MSDRQENPYASWEHHVATVTTDTEILGGDDHWVYLKSVTLDCLAPEDAPCRTYPPDCGCELIQEDEESPGHDHQGHKFTPGQRCWVREWFMAEPMAESTIYVGDDRTDETDCGVPLEDRISNIKIVGWDDAPEWQWAS